MTEKCFLARPPGPMAARCLDPPLDIEQTCRLANRFARKPVGFSLFWYSFWLEPNGSILGLSISFHIEAHGLRDLLEIPVSSDQHVRALECDARDHYVHVALRPA